MDETVIKEIGNQLGMATDNAAQFIQTYLPQYANLRVMLDIAYCIIAAVVFLILLIAFLLAYRVYKKRDDDPDISHWDNEGYQFVCMSFGIFAGIVFVVLIVVCLICIPDAIAWSQFPEAQLINEAIKAIKG